MKFVKQFAIFVTICFIGEVLHKVIPLPVPASIYGLVLMFCALKFKIMPLQEVEVFSDFLLEIMPLLFIPSTVGLIVAWPIIQKHWLPILIITLLGTTFIFFCCRSCNSIFCKTCAFPKQPKIFRQCRISTVKFYGRQNTCCLPV